MCIRDRARVASFLAGEYDESVGVRAFFWEVAARHIALSPGGIGWGGFLGIPSVAPFAVLDARLYPHNVLIEIALEAGWLPAVMIASFVLASVVTSMRSARTAGAAALFSLLLFTLINSLLSGDINDNRLLWVMLVFPWVVRTPGVRGDKVSDHGEYRGSRMGRAAAASPPGGSVSPSRGARRRATGGPAPRGPPPEFVGRSVDGDRRCAPSRRAVSRLRGKTSHRACRTPRRWASGTWVCVTP